MSKTAKAIASIKKSRLRKIAYVYTQVTQTLVNELVNDLQTVNLASIYFSNETNNVSDSSACGFIIKSDNKFVAFGPNAEDDIVEIDTEYIENARKNNLNIEMNEPKITMKEFIEKVENGKYDSIGVFDDVGDAEDWINDANSGNIKARLIMDQYKQLFNFNEVWDILEEFGDQPDIKKEDDNRKDENSGNIKARLIMDQYKQLFIIS